ncbi:putative mitochondrial hypothetical protein [Leptomonas pyrrhocoris]|uniref:Trypanosoma Tc-38 (p38) protein domain-containing protein n=1 Tax=Leptomonas pyrrhocoris TaxID=157538 RepID=A0A0N0DTR4_LEPPY|nr:putative mitochondrial hypothetical protein [Leptomonas pyrrhocoris]KPA77868.1 putative mitochondrial hypothetical protein [Leptomonas pyrrhocoris]|eukprot:XP_015656307.1 putative mitochondrial hypothetical protein [Leptomonas pyrrhocoris]
MLRSRCALCGVQRGVAPHVFLTGSSARWLRASRVLLSAASTPPGVHPALARRAVENKAPSAKHRQKTPTTPEEPLSRPRTHENVFAHQATAALNSLFARPHSSASTAPLDGAAETIDVAESCAAAAEAAVQKTVATTTAAVRDAAPHDEAAPELLVSHGEEELLEDRALQALDMTNPEAYATTTSTHDAPAAATEGEEGQRSAPIPRQKLQAAEGNTATPLHSPNMQDGSRVAAKEALPNLQRPVNLQGALYFGEMASMLQEAAHDRHFVSPVWSTQEAFEAIGSAVEVPDAEGVVLPISSAQQICVFNLEQTSLADRFRVATALELRKYVHDRKRSSAARPSPCRPLTIAGSPLSRERANALANSPTFFHWQEQCPYWVSINDLRVLDAAVRPEMEDQYIMMPRFGVSPSGSRETDGGCSSSSSSSFAADSRTLRRSEVDEEDRMYNLLQLHDDEGRFSRPFGHSAEKLSRCYGIRGTRYSPATTWLMWEYCQRYHFPLSSGRIVMLTAERIQNMGGTVIQEARYPLPQESKAQSHADEEARSNTAAEDGDGVVPPPFTMLIHGEVVTLYNALQTDIPNAIFQYVERQLEDRFKFSFAKMDNNFFRPEHEAAGQRKY